MSVDKETVFNDARNAINDMMENIPLEDGGLFIVGCSSSEIIGEKIGKSSSKEIGEAVFQAIYPILNENDIFLGAQCCEHLNRAVIMEKEAAIKFGFNIVNVVPTLDAGGAFSVAAYNGFKEPVAVEYAQGFAGMDIGDTFIGMHIKPVQVPYRTSVKNIGKAHLSSVYSRLKYIGGPRANYL